MANQFFDHGKHTLGLGDLEFDTADWRCLLVMTGYSFATDRAVTSLSGSTTILANEYDGANYARQALANEAWTKDATNHRSELTCDPIVFSSLGPGSAQCVAAIIFVFITNDSDSYPFLDINDGGFPFDGTGSDNTINPDAEGLIQI